MSEHRGPALEDLETEQVRASTVDLDLLNTRDLVDLMCGDVALLPGLVRAAVPSISQAVDTVTSRLADGGRLIYVGAGTAGRLGMLDAAEAGPTFSSPRGQIIALLAGGDSAFSTPVENAEDDGDAGSAAVRGARATSRDVVLGISASGRTPFVVGALSEARRAGSTTVALACNRDTEIGRLCDIAIEIPVGPEVIAGSTRLNAGTVQKIILNVISTAVMVQLGKTFGNVMIDLRPTNEKLRERAIRMVARVAHCGAEQAREALELSSWRPKVAALMVMAHLDADEAQSELDRVRGHLRAARDQIALTSTVGPSRRGNGAVRRLGVAGALIDGELIEGDVAIADGEIVAVGLSGRGQGVAVPGLVDLQVNGYGGVDLLGADVDDVVAMGRSLLRDGVVAYQPTLITSDEGEVVRAIDVINRARRTAEGARILGVHLEGPFLSPRRSGTHPAQKLRSPDLDLLERLLAPGGVSTVTLAPELPGAQVLIRAVRGRCVVAIGHSAATAMEARQAFDDGARVVTHLFNAMEPMSARQPGLAAAALSDPRVGVHVIADGLHVADEMLRLAFASAKGRCSVVSDALAAAGLADGTYSLGDVVVNVENGVARRADGTLAGGTTPLRQGLHHLSQVGVDPIDALRAVTWLPAREMGRGGIASLRPGSPATMAIVDESLSLTSLLVNGRDHELT